MECVFTWIQRTDLRDRPWLILGKGPTFSLRDRFQREDYATVGLNHVVREERVDIAHAVDIDVVEDCADCLLHNCRYLLMPRHPHRYHQATPLALEDFVATLPLLQRFDQEGRLLWYNLHTGPRIGPFPTARGTFSGSVVMNLLGHLGARRVRSLGVDGGKSYSASFKDLESKTLLSNGHDSFDVQKREISATAKDFGMTYEPLIEPIRIFVGCDDSQLIAARVLEYSIRKHTKRPIEFFPMCNMPSRSPKHRKNRPGTGFSFNRFLIPKLSGYQGKAIYLDADMLVFDDIEELWNVPFADKSVLCAVQHETPDGWKDGNNNPLGADRYFTPGRQMSVMLMNCERLDWDVDEIVRGLDEERYSYKDLMARFCIVPEDEIGDTIPPEWNCLEWYEPERSRLVHFTVVPTQPWKNDKSELEELWRQAYREAVRAGAVPLELIQESVERKLVKPVLLQIAQEELAASRNASVVNETPPDESARLRTMLWDAMIAGHRAETELQRMRRSPAWQLEETLIRRPLRKGFELAYRGVRRAYRAMRPAA